MNKVPFALFIGYSVTLYYPSTHCILILTNPLTTDNAGIWAFDIETNKIIDKYPYPDKLHAVSDYTIDQRAGIIYMLSSNNNISSFDINSGEWTIDFVVDNSNSHSIYNIFHVSSETELTSLHIIGRKLGKNQSIFHDVYDLEKGRIEFEAISTIDKEIYNNEDQDPTKIMHDSNKNRLIMIPSWYNKVFICDLSKSDKKWEEFTNSFEEDEHGGLYTFHAVLAWNQIIFGFQYDQNNIYCLDLDHSEIKWIKCDHRIDFKDQNPVTIIDKDNSMHTIHFSDQIPYYFKAKLIDLVPTKILDLNRGKYKPLIHGYIREYMMLPSDLIQMILLFYPVFV